MKTNMLAVRRCLREHRSSVAIAMIQLVLLFIVMAYCMTVRAQTNAVPAAVAASSMPFHPYDDLKGRTGENHVPDLPEEFTGVVIAVWNADTAPNRRACQSRWLFKRATETLCASLARQKIVSVRTDPAGLDLVAYVAVSQTKRVAINERVRVRRARQDSDGAIVSMPVLTAIYPPATVGGGSLTSR